jgi:hypothetical protein
MRPLGTTFIYTLFNDEPVGSSHFVNLFHLNVAAPITVTSTAGVGIHDRSYHVRKLDELRYGVAIPRRHRASGIGEV